MRSIRTYFEERYIHLAFEVSLWLKGAFALVEILGGIVAFFVVKQFLVAAATFVTQGELAEDPHDLVANTLLHSAQNLSIDTQHFTALYLFSHGAIKLWLIAGLLRERLWYYPMALFVFGLFVLYQLYRYGQTHSVLLVLITLIDIVVMILTWHEYRYLTYRNQHSSPAK